MSEPIGQAGPPSIPTPPPANVFAISQQLQQQVLAFAQDLAQLVEHPGLSDDLNFINQVHDDASKLKETVDTALKLG